jgi:DNA-binding transcriptional MerR regulator
MGARLSIGMVARQAGATVATVRYYEEIGLLSAAPRTESGQRSYDAAAVKRLVFIRRCREFGFSIDQVRELVNLVDHPRSPCDDVRAIAAVHLAEVRRKLDELKALEAALGDFVRSCDAGCAGGAIGDCTILEDLAGPAPTTRGAKPGGCCGA